MSDNGQHQLERLLPGVFVWWGSIITLLLGGASARLLGDASILTPSE